MNLFAKNDSDRYAVSIVKDKDSSLTLPASRFRRGMKSTIKFVSGALLTAMVTALMMGGYIAGAPQARADFISDGFKAAMCSNGSFNYELEAINLEAKTADPTDLKATAYEKYGMSGTTWTLWSGPEKQEGLDNAGEFGGKSIVDDAGGKANNGGIDNWGDQDKTDGDVSTVYPAFYNTKQECVPGEDVVATAIANGTMIGTKNLTYWSGKTFQYAYEQSNSVTALFMPVLGSVITELKSAIYFEFLMPFLMLIALRMAWVGLVKRQATIFVQDLGWTIGFMVLGTMAMVNPMFVPQQVDAGVSSLSQGVISAITKPASGVSPDDGICYVDPSSNMTYSTDKNDAPKDSWLDALTKEQRAAARQTSREVQCNLYYAFVYTPWVTGQFGEDDEDRSAGWPSVGNIGAPLEGTNIDNGVTVSGQQVKNSWAMTFLDAKVMKKDTPESERIVQQRQLLNVTAAQLHRDSPNMVFKGENSEQRIGIAGQALLASLASALLVISASLLIIVLKLAIIMLWTLSPFFFLAGLHSGQGRRIAMGYFELIIGLAIKQIAVSAALGLMILFYRIVIGANLPPFLANLVILALTVAAFMYKDKILAQFTKVNLGSGGYGEKMMNAPKEAQQKFQRNAGKAAAIGAGLGAMFTTGNPGAAMTAADIAESAVGGNKGAGARPNEESDRRVSPEAGEQESAKPGKTDGAGGRPTAVPGEPVEESAEDSMPVDNTSGAGDRPTTVPTEPNQTHQSVFIPDTDSRQDRRNRARVERENLKRIEEARRREGYRRTVVGPGLVSRTITAAAMSKLTTGSTTAAILAATNTVTTERTVQMNRNARADRIVRQQEMDAYEAQQKATASEAPVAPKRPRPAREEPSAPVRPAPAPEAPAEAPQSPRQKRSESQAPTAPVRPRPARTDTPTRGGLPPLSGSRSTVGAGTRP